MASAISDTSPSTAAGPDAGGERAPLRSTAADGVKIVVVGGFGVGKTTLVRAVSEIRPLSTEEVMTQAGADIDDTSGVQGKNSTTVAFDFGRISLDEELVLYLFGAPGQKRFWFLWDQLFAGALGVVVLLDTRRIEDSWYSIDRLEAHGVPFIVACNRFGGEGHSVDEVRDALELPATVPVIDCDARDRESAREVLITLVHHLHTLSAAQEDPQ